MTEVPIGTSDAELARARQLLAASAHLVAGGFLEDAVSRAYYAIFHAACALRRSADRNDADYAVVSTFTQKDVEETLVQAGEFVEAVAKLLG